nr:guard cell S-type anion channel SLAC1 [Tanacetum cinerariifolium]
LTSFLQDTEDILLPKDKKWPFLLRFPIGCFAIRREYFHPVRINFFFAPWVVCMFLAIGAPPIIAQKPLHPAIWQVSLETGVSKLNKAHNEVKVLPRSGRSFSGFGSSHGVDHANVKKGDFNMFRTKSTLSKQNSFMLPLRKDSGVNQFHKNGEEGVGLLDETFDKSVPAGRYFAALTGPDLELEKKIRNHEDTPYRWVKRLLSYYWWCPNRQEHAHDPWCKKEVNTHRVEVFSSYGFKVKYAF